MSDATALVISNLAWPVAIVIIAVVVLITQREPIGEMIARIKSLKYPGGAAEISEAVPEQGAVVISSLVDSLYRGLSERLIELDVPRQRQGEDVVIDNRERLGEFDTPPAKAVVSLVQLRGRIADVLPQLAVPPPAGGYGTISATIGVLRNRGVIDGSVARKLLEVAAIADQAAAGSAVPPNVANAVHNSGSAIIDQLAEFGKAAPVLFEAHVLEVLARERPGGWQVTQNAHVAELGVRADAQISDGGQHVIMEVRARLQPESHVQLEEVRAWLTALPASVPVLIVMLGDGLTGRQQRRLREIHSGPVELLLWDRDADFLIPALQGMLRAAAADAASSV